MTLEEKYQLSCYQELGKIEKQVYLVKNIETGELFVKKKVALYNLTVYRLLMDGNFPNIPHIQLLIEENDGLIVIEEYIHGDTLASLIQKNGLMKEEQVLAIGISVCEILSRLHHNFVTLIHRDIKPSNIMISKDGVVKLIDFNAAKAVETEKAEDTRLIGTQEFAAPEQYGFGQSSSKTDIYALGVTMNYLLTGDYPKNKLWEGKLRPVIENCIPINPDDRYESIDAVERALLKVKARMEKKNGDGGRDREHQKRPSVFVRPLYDYREWLPIGFRSGILWKMLVALYGYILIFGICLTVVVTQSGDIPATGIYLWTNRIFLVLMILGVIYLFGNYCGIRDHLPLMNKNRLLRYIMLVVYSGIYVFLMFFLLAVVVSFL